MRVGGLVTENKCAGKIYAVPLFDHLLKSTDSYENGDKCKKLGKILSLSLVIVFEMLLESREKNHINCWETSKQGIVVY